MTTVIIILSAIIVIAVIIIAVLWVTRKRAVRHASQAVENRLRREIRTSQNELERITILYNNLKTNAQTNSTSKTVATVAIDQSTTPESLAIERHKLETDRNEMAERNRKLWEMSLAIEKEKQHISVLKNEIESKHYAVTSSIRYAQRIQLAVLPSEDILKNAFSDFFLFWRPRDIVSGDYYWHRRKGNIIAFTIADCTGHGVPGSFMSLLGITYLNDLTTNLTHETLPSDILNNLRAKIITALSQHHDKHEPTDGMDMAFCILNLDTNILRFSGANNPLYIISDGELTEYKPVKNPIGQYPRMQDFKTVEISLHKGDYLYMFCDGYADQFNGKTKKKVTYGRLKEILLEINTQSSESEYQKERLGEFLDQWRGSLSQMDDILIGGYRV
ncbi:MAG: SpoIIE family protein phosphatase [Bacteroidales bacterium]|nr:SpoIIE family protein phosphatase [Bacteroidales bacterium]